MSFWSKDAPVIDPITHKVVRGGMFPAQRAWWDSDRFIKAFIGGYGSGKTYIGAKRAISLALENAPSPFLMVSPSYKIARRTIVPTIRALLNGKQTLLPSLKYKYNRSSFEFKIWYHGREATIWCVSGDDPDSLKGPNVGAAGVDEPFIQDEEVLEQVVARVRDPIAKRMEIGLTGTPEQLNWGYDICEGERAEDYNVDIYRASTKENESLSPDYYQRLLGILTEQAAQAYLHGHFMNLTEGRVYYGMGPNNFVELEDPGTELFVGMDFNVNPMACCVFWTKGNHMHVIAEHELPNADTQYLCQVLKDTYKGKDGRCRIHKIFPDASGVARSTNSPGGKSDFHYIKEAGFDVDAPNANPRIRDRENAVNGKLAPAAGNPTLTFSPSCKKIKAYMAKYTHKDRNKPEQKAMSHLLDSLGYPVHRLFPVHEDLILIRKLQGL